MPVVEITGLLRPEHVVEFLAQYLEESDIGIAKVVKYDEQLIDEYPAVQVFPGQFTKELHGTHTFALGLRADIYVMHAKMTLDRMTRNYEDLALATEIVAYLERDMRFHDESGNARLIHSFVESERFAARPPRTNKDVAVVGTLLNWMGVNQGRF